jgi:hypothetical protein
MLIAIALDDGNSLGVLSSRVHVAGRWLPAGDLASATIRATTNPAASKPSPSPSPRPHNKPASRPRRTDRRPSQARAGRARRADADRPLQRAGTRVGAGNTANCAALSAKEKLIHEKGLVAVLKSCTTNSMPPCSTPTAGRTSRPTNKSSNASSRSMPTVPPRKPQAHPLAAARLPGARWRAGAHRTGVDRRGPWRPAGGGHRRLGRRCGRTGLARQPARTNRRARRRAFRRAAKRSATRCPLQRPRPLEIPPARTARHPVHPRSRPPLGRWAVDGVS